MGVSVYITTVSCGIEDVRRVKPVDVRDPTREY